MVSSDAEYLLSVLIFTSAALTCLEVGFQDIWWKSDRPIQDPSYPTG